MKEVRSLCCSELEAEVEVSMPYAYTSAESYTYAGAEPDELSDAKQFGER